MPKTSRRFAAAEAVVPAGYAPPANPEAEQSVLGAILVRPEVMDRGLRGSGARKRLGLP